MEHDGLDRLIATLVELRKKGKKGTKRDVFIEDTENNQILRISHVHIDDDGDVLITIS